MDYFLRANSSYARLEGEFKKYGKLIFALDFDDTIFDYHDRGVGFDNIINLLKRYQNGGYSEVIIFTCNGKDRYPEIEEYLARYGIEYKGINVDSSFSCAGRKIFANVYIDDRAGLYQVYNELKTLIERIERGEVKYYPTTKQKPVKTGYIKSLIAKYFPSKTKESDEEKVEYTYSFDAYAEKEYVVSWIKNWFANNGIGCNCVIGISGGKDSTIAAALCAEALGKDRVIGVLMPDGKQTDLEDAKKVVELLGIKSYTINISNMTTRVISGVKTSDITVSNQATVNLPARIRMAVLYTVSQSLNGRVVCTTNKSEDYVGYVTNFGDDLGDLYPLADLTSSEVKALGYELNIPEYLIEKAPADGLCGKTDEESLGFSYDILDLYIRTGVCEDEDIKKKIDSMHENSKFKRGEE